VQTPVADALTADLLAWYREAGRTLPWRETRDPYAILVSEVMLQQTQVARVLERWPAWIARWPTAEALAAAPLAEVIAAWSGLGYNRRAVALHRACVAIAADGFPGTYDGLLRLPGIGPYTAAAVACIALGEERIPEDVNVRRIATRALGGATIAPPGGGGAAELTQALFDLGATVCIARRPRCAACPLAARCPSAGQTFAAERRQAPFAGSRRERRGALLRRLTAGGVAVVDADEEIANSLVRDGLAEIADGRITLPAR
jgi:A/G-specific adenine glycosylase